MGTVYFAANFITATNWTLNAAHLQFAYENNGNWYEVEVQGPGSLILGDWDFYTDGTRPHGGEDSEGYAYTSGVALDGSFADSDRYVRVALTPNEGQSSEELWQLIQKVGTALADVGELLNYDVFQNSNSFATTVLETIGYSYEALVGL